MSNYGPRVIREYADDDDSARGLVVGWEDEERCLVLWGDAALNPDEHLDEARVEYMDALIPVTKKSRSKRDRERAKKRVAEFVRQWEIRKDARDYNTDVYSVHFDPNTDDGATLTIDDLKSILKGA